MQITNAEFQRRLNEASKAMLTLPGEAMAVQGQELLGLMLGRIFNRGLAADMKQIGKYDDTKKQTFLTDNVFDQLNKKSQRKVEKKLQEGDEAGHTYKELRELAGLQTEYVDLQFTGAMFESVQQGVSGNTFSIGFTNAGRAKIAGYLEKKYGRPIFELSKQEIDESIRILLAYIRERISQLLVNGIRPS
jgi:hypothetical protein